MASVVPFHGIHYNPKLVNQMASLATPPYDVVRDNERMEYSRRSAYNMIKLDLPTAASEGDFYSYSCRLFSEWLLTGVLIEDERTHFYVLRETFRDGDRQRNRTGFFGAVKIEPEGSNVILPHERTLEKPVQDRLNLLRASRANYSPVFFIYEDPKLVLETALENLGEPPLFTYIDDREVQRTLWPIRDPELLRIFQTTLEQKQLIIADGHHRYRTALAYREENPSATHLLGYLTNSHQEDFIIRPIHRAIPFSLLGERFSFEHFAAALEKHCEQVERIRAPKHLSALKISRGTIIIAETKTRQAVRVTPFVTGSAYDQVETVTLENQIFRKLLSIEPAAISIGSIHFFHSEEGYREELGKVNPQLIFLLPSPTFQNIADACREGRLLPQKSTFFFPKIPTGLIIRKI